MIKSTLGSCDLLKISWAISFSSSFLNSSFGLVYFFCEVGLCSIVQAGLCLSHYVVQAGFELVVLLPQHPDCWDYWYAQPYWVFDLCLVQLFHTPGFVVLQQSVSVITSHFLFFCCHISCLDCDPLITFYKGLCHHIVLSDNVWWFPQLHSIDL